MYVCKYSVHLLTRVCKVVCSFILSFAEAGFDNDLFPGTESDLLAAGVTVSSQPMHAVSSMIKPPSAPPMLHLLIASHPPFQDTNFPFSYSRWLRHSQDALSPGVPLKSILRINYYSKRETRQLVSYFIHESRSVLVMSSDTIFLTDLE